MSKHAHTISIWRRTALLLFALALLVRLPAGFMPQAHAASIGFGWCNAVSAEAAIEGKKLLEAALGDRPAPKETQTGDQPCAFAAAAQPIAPTAPAEIMPPVAAEPFALQPALTPFPGRGLVAPPPFATGPPHLA